MKMKIYARVLQKVLVICYSIFFQKKGSHECSIYLIYIHTEHIFIQLILDHDVIFYSFS